MPRFSLILGAAIAAFCVGCGALKPPAAQFPTTITSPTVYALNGSPAATPAGIDFLSGSAVSVDANFYFNVALDIDSAGRIVIYPARKVVTGLASVNSVGLQKIGGIFDDYTQAAKGGYTYDSTLVVPVGQVVGVNVLDATTCTVYSLGSSYYAKFVVDSINPLLRAMYTRVISDPNCGYTTLTPGVPTK
ncbi:MAG: hypothetical protein ACYCVL_12170 [Gemmatimonadaceae bacterium]